MGALRHTILFVFAMILGLAWVDGFPERFAE